MKKNYLLKTVSAALVIASLSFVSCNTGDDNENGGGVTPPAENTELIGELTSNRTLGKDKVYSLTGGFHVKPGVTLTIEQGVKIVAKDDDIVDYILVEQGAKIDAQGTADNPIVMTAEREQLGSWGGLHICGKAPINVAGGTSKSEIGDALYGGNDAGDNSGIMKYIRVEYAGYAFSEEKEGNGFTFYGVGNGTTVDYVQAFQGSDDGFEFFGGTVNVKHIVSTSNSDDSFDWTEGWRGCGQFMVAYQQDMTQLGYDCDALMECDNNSKDAMAQPISHPILSNLTLVGNNSQDEKRGIRLRAGTQVEIYNAIVKGKIKNLTTQTPETETALSNNISKLQYIVLENTVTSEDNGYGEEKFLADGTNTVNAQITLEDNFFGTLEGGVDAHGINNFFDNVSYKGAISKDNNWMSGWTR